MHFTSARHETLQFQALTICSIVLAKQKNPIGIVHVVQL